MLLPSRISALSASVEFWRRILVSNVTRDIISPALYASDTMTKWQSHTYLIALGSNVRHVRYGAPPKVLAAALEEMENCGIELLDVAATISSRPLGPSLRLYANSAAVICTEHDPARLLAALQKIEAKFGRNRSGSRWRARTLDLDIVLWSGGIFASSALAIPHQEFRERDFVLGPAAEIAGEWRDPVTNLSMRQLAYRLNRPN